MACDPKIQAVDLARLGVIRYPDPRLREVATPVEDPTDPCVRALVDRMFELMFSSRGVGLAAPQVGVTVRLFVGSPTFEASDRRVYVNPEIIALEGRQDGEEGCLSFPQISISVRRYAKATIRATDLEGNVFEETGSELTARLFQHETDHLDGRLLVDKMSRLDKLSHRQALRELEQAGA
jgi:peptide deformylase